MMFFLFAFYDVFPIRILYFIKICLVLSVIILKHVVTPHFHCLCYPFGVQKFFSWCSEVFLTIFVFVSVSAVCVFVLFFT
jgi:hypothetical protein